MIDSKHTHGEAFKLMTYACACGHRETIWNSRDGVTPFGMECQSCGGMDVRHVDWKRDVYAPHHKLHKGQRFWRDGTPDEAEAIMRGRIESYQDTYPCTPEKEAELIRIAREGEGEFRKGWPMLDRHEGRVAVPPNMYERIRELRSTSNALMAKLASMLDDDHFAICEEILRKGGIEPPTTSGPEQWERTAKSVSSMVIEWVDGANRMGTDWRPGLDNVIQARLYRLSLSSNAPKAEGATVGEAARLLYDNWAGLHDMPSPAREKASQGHFFSALRLIFEPNADLRKPPSPAPRAEVSE